MKNIHQKYEGINAIRYNDANQFLQALKDRIKKKEYFLFGCDICSKITNFYSDLINEFPEQKEDFILITSKTNIYIENAHANDMQKHYDRNGEKMRIKIMINIKNMMVTMVILFRF